MKTIITANIILAKAFECAFDNLVHPMYDGFEIFPEKSVEVYLKTSSRDEDGNLHGMEECTFRCKLQKRTSMGWGHSIPLKWDAYCILVPQFHIKSIKRPNGWRTSDMSEFWWKQFNDIMEQATSLVPEAIFDEGSKTWWIGDYGFNTEKQEEVKR